MVRRTLSAVIVVISWGLAPNPTFAQDLPRPPACVGGGDLGQVGETCDSDAERLQHLSVKHPGSIFTFESEKEVCSREDPDGDLCSTPHSCAGESQDFYRVTLGSVWQGFACLTPDEVAELRINWYALATQAMREFEWPAAELEVSPSGGEVLVNGVTRFATDRRASEQVVRELHGRVLTVRATPVSYRWVFGDGEEDMTRAFVARFVDHTYLGTGEYEARVDVTYSGEYRVGEGAWVALSDTLTVRGPALTLTAVEARPVLVL